MQKNKQQKLISTVLLLSWMTIIFLMSARNADVIKEMVRAAKSA